MPAEPRPARASTRRTVAHGCREYKNTMARRYMSFVRISRRTTSLSDGTMVVSPDILLIRVVSLPIPGREFCMFFFARPSNNYDL